MEKGAEGKAGRKVKQKTGAGRPLPLPFPRSKRAPAPLWRQPPARPSEPAKACAAPAPRWRPPPLTGCRRPRSARRARCWGGAGSGTWRRQRRRRGGGAGEGASERQGPGAAGSRAAEASLRSCTQRHRRPPAASRETSRGASGEMLGARRETPGEAAGAKTGPALTAHAPSARRERARAQSAPACCHSQPERERPPALRRRPRMRAAPPPRPLAFPAERGRSAGAALLARARWRPGPRCEEGGRLLPHAVTSGRHDSLLCSRSAQQTKAAAGWSVGL